MLVGIDAEFVALTAEETELVSASLNSRFWIIQGCNNPGLQILVISLRPVVALVFPSLIFLAL